MYIFNFKSTQSLDKLSDTSLTSQTNLFPTLIRCWHLKNWNTRNHISVSLIIVGKTLQFTLPCIWTEERHWEGTYFEALISRGTYFRALIVSLWYGHNCSSTAVMSIMRPSFNTILWWRQALGGAYSKCIFKEFIQCIFWKIYLYYLGILLGQSNWSYDKDNPQCKYKKLKKFHVIPNSKILFVIEAIVCSLLCSSNRGCACW